MSDKLTKALEGKYKIIREIGRGGMATVYLAEDFRHGREVAVKVLHPDLASALGTDRFLREIRLAAQRVGLTERGLLRPGMYADITVFDPNTIIDNSTYEQPQQLATGVSYVFVNGVAVLDDGKPTAALPGRALRGPAYRKR